MFNLLWKHTGTEAIKISNMLCCNDSRISLLRNNCELHEGKTFGAKRFILCYGKGSLSFSFTELYYWKFAHFIRISMIPVVFYKYLRIQMKCIQLNKIDFVGCGWECVAIWQVSVCSKYWHKSSVRHNYYHHMCGQIADMQAHTWQEGICYICDVSQIFCRVWTFCCLESQWPSWVKTVFYWEL